MEVFPKYQESVFSDDTICGALFDNGLTSPAILKRACPDAKILLVIRNQKSIINSAYRTYVKAGGAWGFCRYAEEIMRQGKYDYFALASRYIELFGREGCLILQFEELMTHPQAYLERVARFIGAGAAKPHDLSPVRPGPSKYYNAAMRLVNIASPNPRLRSWCLRWGVTLDNKLVKPFQGQKQFGYERVAPRITAAYAESNRRLESLLGINLKRLGY